MLSMGVQYGPPWSSQTLVRGRQEPLKRERTYYVRQCFFRGTDLIWKKSQGEKKIKIPFPKSTALKCEQHSAQAVGEREKL